MDMEVYWYWLTAGMILMVFEIVTPGIFFLWVGLGALLTGMIAFFFPALSGEVLGILFGVLAVVSTLIGRKLISKKQEVPSVLNSRASMYVGKIYQVYETITDGRGKISVGDTVWQAEADQDIPANSSVKVVGVNGTALKVEPVETKSASSN